MALKSYPYSSSVISFRLNALLSRDDILSAAQSDTAEAAMLLLQEKGFAKGAPEMENPYAFEDIIAYEMAETVTLLRKIAPDEHLLSMYLLKYDYLNLKMLLKLDLLGVEFSEKSITPYGAIPFTVLKQSIADRYYGHLPKEMQIVLQHLDKQFAIHEDPSLIGLALDKAYSRQINRLLMDVKNPLIHAYFDIYFDFTNIIMMMRMKNARRDAGMLADVLLEGGKLKKAEIIRAFEDPSGTSNSAFYRFGYEKYLKAPMEKLTGNDGLFAIEIARDDCLLALVKQERYDVFSSTKAITYLISKEREAAVVRILMVSILNHIGADEMGSRLKELYV